MNQLVPGLHELREDCSTPASPGSSRPNKLQAIRCDDDVMELLWENGQVIVQRSSKKAPISGADGDGEAEIPAEQLTVRGVRSSAEELHLFMQEDEMASWLQYPMEDSSFDRDLYSDLLYSAPPPSLPIPIPITTITPPRTVAEIQPHSTRALARPPIPPSATNPDNSPRFQNFVHFSRLPIRPRNDPATKPSVSTVRESTVVESNETPAVEGESRVSHSAGDCRTVANTESGTAAVSASAAATREFTVDTCEVTVSSPDGSGSSFSASGERLRSRHQPTPADDRKRKEREAFSSDNQSEEFEFKCVETKRSSRGAAATKRYRAADVHNLSERRRRDRINEKMRTLQQLIPRCNKTDKASMLDEAIVYLKSLQMQVQMMSMGCGMVPGAMMYPGMQRFVTPMGMGMGMGMDMAMNRPVMPYPSMLPVSGIPRFHPSPLLGPDSSTNTHNHTSSSQGNDHPMIYSPHVSFQPRIPNYMFQHQQLFPGFHPAAPPLPLPQNQAAMQPTTADIPNTSTERDSPLNLRSG